MQRVILTAALVALAANSSAAEYHVKNMTVHLPAGYESARKIREGEIFASPGQPTIVVVGMWPDGAVRPGDRELILKEITPKALDQSIDKGHWKVVHELKRIDMPNGCTVMTVVSESTKSKVPQFLISSSIVSPGLIVANVNIQGEGPAEPATQSALSFLTATTVEP